MLDENIKQAGIYPWRVVLTRWLLLAAEAALAIYLVITFRLELGVLFIAYGIVCLFLLLPLIRCVRCAYYGKRCSFGWGTWVASFFPPDTTSDPHAYYGYTMAFWPLRLLPILLGLLGLLNGFIASFTFVPHGLFGIYLLVLLLHRLLYRSRACPGCELKASCPVYGSDQTFRDVPG